MSTVHCHRCGEPRTVAVSKGVKFFAHDAEGHNLCYACCGDLDREAMANCEAGEHFTLYVSWENYMPVAVINWPGTLYFDLTGRSKGHHNWGLTRWDVWFKDHTGAQWWGFQIGGFTDLVHCRKLKPLP